MAERQTWGKVSTEDEKKPLEKVLDSLPTKEEFIHRVRVAVNVFLLLLLLTVGGVIEFVVIETMHKSDYSEAKARFKRQGRAEDGQRISEMGLACRNGSEMQLSCGLLYKSISSVNSFVATREP